MDLKFFLSFHRVLKLKGIHTWLLGDGRRALYLIFKALTAWMGDALTWQMSVKVKLKPRAWNSGIGSVELVQCLTQGNFPKKFVKNEWTNESKWANKINRAVTCHFPFPHAWGLASIHLFQASFSFPLYIFIVEPQRLCFFKPAVSPWLFLKVFHVLLPLLLQGLWLLEPVPTHLTSCLQRDCPELVDP